MLADKYFKKRTYGFRSCFSDVLKVMRKSFRIRESMNSQRVSSKFREKIMLAVTAVNSCKYCEWGHTKAALKSGCTEKEIKEIMINDFGSCDPDEVIALAFAQQYSELSGNYSEESWNKLIETYDGQRAKDILLYIQMVTIGNLLGNTIEGFGSRLKGKPPEKGSLAFELFIYIFGWPFILIMNKKMKK